MARGQKREACGQGLLNRADPLKFVSPAPPPFKPSSLTSGENKRGRKPQWGGGGGEPGGEKPEKKR